MITKNITTGKYLAKIILNTSFKIYSMFYRLCYANGSAFAV